MVIDELDLSPQYRLSRIMRILESMYGITIDFDSVNDRADLESIYEEYGLVRQNIIREAHYNTYNQIPEYTKACLIQEAICIFLSEVAPKRRNRRRQGHA